MIGLFFNSQTKKKENDTKEKKLNSTFLGNKFNKYYSPVCVCHHWRYMLGTPYILDIRYSNSLHIYLSMCLPTVLRKNNNTNNSNMLFRSTISLQMFGSEAKRLNFQIATGLSRWRQCSSINQRMVLDNSSTNNRPTYYSTFFFPPSLPVPS